MVTSKREDRSRILRCVDQSVAEEARTRGFAALAFAGCALGQKLRIVRLPYGVIPTASTILWSILDQHDIRGCPKVSDGPFQ